MKNTFTLLIAWAMLILSSQAYSQDFGCNATFETSGESINIGSNADFYSSTLTVEARIKASEWRNAIHEGSVLSSGTWSSGEKGWDLRAANNGNMSFNFANGGWNETQSSGDPMELNTWYHIAATFNEGVVKIYINGEQVGIHTYSQNNLIVAPTLLIGNCPDQNTRNFKGQIDEVRIWNTVVDSATIVAWHNQELTSTHPNYSNIVAYYPFTNQSANNAAGSSNNGTINGNVEMVNCSETCADVSGITTTDITGNSATLSWLAGGTETNWNVIVSPTEITDFSAETSLAVTDTFYQATGLSSETQYYVYVQANCGSDDLASWVMSTFTTTVTCPAPTSLQASNILETSATIAWSAGASESSWKVIVSPTEITDFTTATSVTVTDTFYQATSLNSTTTYHVYVQAICADDDLSSWAQTTFSTACGTITSFPWIEEFENWTNITNCWDLSGGNHEVSQYNNNAVKANYWSWSNGSNAYLELPNFNFSALSNPTIEFKWSHKYSSTYPNDKLELQISQDDGTTWVSVWTKTGTDLNSNDGAGDQVPGSYVSSGEINISAYGNSPKIRFNFTSGYGPDCFIDNVKISDVTCPAPSSFEAFNITAHSTEIEWTLGNAETQWIVQYDTTGFNIGTGTEVIASNDTLEITGLTPETDYDVYVRALCGTGDSSIWIGPLSFTTLVSCPAPSSFEAFNTTINSTEIEWTLGNEETQWIVQYGEDGFAIGTGTELIASNDTLEITGLTPETNYDAYVRALCGAGDSSTWVGPLSFTTLISCPAPTNLQINDITETTSTISWSAGASESSWKVIVSPTEITDFTAATSVTVTDTFYQATGLAHSTYYYVYVESICADDDLSSWLNGNFTTLCQTISSFPWTEEFENWTSITNCWDLTGGDHEVSQYESSAVKANYWSWSSGNNAYLSFPSFDLSTLSNPTIEFKWSHKYNSSYPNDKLELQVSQDNGTTWVSVWTKVGETLNSNDGAGDQVPGSYVSSGEINIGAYGNTPKIRFNFTSGYGPDCFIDNVKISDVTCPAPTDAEAFDITDNTASLKWNAGASETQWIVQYGADGFAIGTGTELSASDTSIEITGLTNATQYDAYIRAFCGTGDSSAWVGPISFTTLDEYFSDEADILTFSIDNQVGNTEIITEDKKVKVTMPYGSELNNLVANFTLSEGASATVTGTAQVSGTTANDWSSAAFLEYYVLAEDGATAKTWKVYVSTVPNTENDILTFTIPNQVGETEINNTEHKVTVNMSAETSLANLVPSFTLSDEATAKVSGIIQESGLTSHSWESVNYIEYSVIAGNNDAQTWKVYVQNVANNAAEITKFKLIPTQQIGVTCYNSEDSIVAVVARSSVNLSQIVPWKFEVSEGATATYNGSTVIEGSTMMDFSDFVYILVTAEDGVTTKTWKLNAWGYCTNVININSEAEQFNIYPNPTKGSLQIESALEASELIDIEIINTAGQVVKRISKVETSNTINLEEQTNGLYLVKINTTKGIIVKKINILK